MGETPRIVKELCVVCNRYHYLGNACEEATEASTFMEDLMNYQPEADFSLDSDQKKRGGAQ